MYYAEKEELIETILKTIDVLETEVSTSAVSEERKSYGGMDHTTNSIKKKIGCSAKNVNAKCSDKGRS